MGASGSASCGGDTEVDWLGVEIYTVTLVGRAYPIGIPGQPVFICPFGNTIFCDPVACVSL